MSTVILIGVGNLMNLKNCQTLFILTYFFFGTNFAFSDHSYIQADLSHLKAFLAVSSFTSTRHMAEEVKTLSLENTDYALIEKNTAFHIAQPLASALCKFYGFDRLIKYSIKPVESDTLLSQPIWVLKPKNEGANDNQNGNPSFIQFEEREFQSAYSGTRLRDKTSGKIHYGVRIPSYAQALSPGNSKQEAYRVLTKNSGTYVLSFDQYEQNQIPNWVFDQLICEGDPVTAGTVITWRSFHSMSLDQVQEILVYLGTPALHEFLALDEQSHENPDHISNLMNQLGLEVYLNQLLYYSEDQK